MTLRTASEILPAGLSTGIGHLPHYDPGDAVEFVLRHSPKLPSAPALPARSRREGMIAQAATGIAGVAVADDGSLFIDHDELDPDAPLLDTGFRSDAFVGLRAFLTAVADRVGPLKVSTTGPITLGLALHTAGIDADLAFRIAGMVVRQRSAALMAHVLRRVPQAQLVLFLDEPAMGSLSEPGFPIAPSDGVDLVSGALAVVEATAVTGLHCCTTADYRLLLSAGPRILSVPVRKEITAHAGLFGDFLERGGWMAWGAVPTDGPVGTTVDRLWRRLVVLGRALVEDGLDPQALISQSIITPTCGLAQHGVTQAELVMELTSGVADRLQQQSAGFPFSVGA
jgi:hypothetical protein